MHIEINVTEQGLTAQVVSADPPTATDAGAPTLTEAAVAAASGSAEDAGPPRVTMDHPLAAQIGIDADEVHDGGPAPRFD